MILSLIVAMTKDRVIGRNNQLPWHLSADLKRFKRLTMGHPIIMGRKTFDSIGKPLPGRENVVVTRDQGMKIEGVRLAHSLEEALAPYKNKEEECFVIGGAALFAQAFPKASKIYLTWIETPVQGDVFFPPFDLNKEFKTVDQSPLQFDQQQGLRYSFVTAERIF